ncbi:MAG: hypothetical protein K8I02_11855, partial [Candidatus Methylomirabilis sp.]|nr:hypothetical protein [Deltaproteobacteria bacterium]
VAPTPTDRPYWEERASRDSLLIVDAVLELLRTINRDFEAKYNKYYIGLALTGSFFNLGSLKPQKKRVRCDVKVSFSEDLRASLEEAGFDSLDYDARRGRFRFALAPGDVDGHRDVLLRLFEAAHKESLE